MEINEIINKAKIENRSALDEVESKRIIAHYGIPVIRESIALTMDDAIQMADKIGYPVVLKGLGSRLMHKTERGLVHVNLRNSVDVSRAAKDIILSAGDDLEGYLVQPMIRGSRELMAGVFCDPIFGPTVMFGLGGIFTEAIGDVVYGIAPLNEVEANAMIEDLRCSKLLGSIRGQSVIDRSQLIQILLGLSRLATKCTDIAELDVNPLIADENGNLVAVDALVILGKREHIGSKCKFIDEKSILELISPRSIAFVGASKQYGKWGYRLPANTIAGGYPGEIYFVNPNEDAIAGRKVFKSIMDIPGHVDLAIVTIPAAKVIELIPQIKRKGIRYMIVISSGFAETGIEGAQLERDLIHAATEADITFIGPNMMGICNPQNKLFSMHTSCWPKPGSISLISQSGNVGSQFMLAAEKENIGLRLFCGSGNEAMVGVEEFLGALEEDDLTKVINIYLEGVKNGRRFLDMAKRVSRKKPIIMLKGGRTEEGSIAAASHTGAMASNIKILNAACNQAGIVQARHTLDLLDYSAAFSSLPPPMGNRVALITRGGGWGVITTDRCTESGLAVPKLPEDLISTIDDLLPSYWSRGNPVDLVAEFDISIVKIILELMAKWNGCDAILHLGVVGSAALYESVAIAYGRMDSRAKEIMLSKCNSMNETELSYLDFIIELIDKYKKPIIGVTQSSVNVKMVWENTRSKFKAVVYPTPERAVNALASVVNYNKWLMSHHSSGNSE